MKSTNSRMKLTSLMLAFTCKVNYNEYFIGSKTLHCILIYTEAFRCHSTCKTPQVQNIGNY